MKTLREVLADADVRHVAVGHFNISDLGALKAIFSILVDGYHPPRLLLRMTAIFDFCPKERPRHSRIVNSVV